MFIVVHSYLWDDQQEKYVKIQYTNKSLICLL